MLPSSLLQSLVLSQPSADSPAALAQRPHYCSTSKGPPQLSLSLEVSEQASLLLTTLHQIPIAWGEKAEVGPLFLAVEWVCWELPPPGRTLKETFIVYKQILTFSGISAPPSTQNYLSPLGPRLMSLHVLRPPPGLCLLQETLKPSKATSTC